MNNKNNNNNSSNSTPTTNKGGFLVYAMYGFAILAFLFILAVEGGMIKDFRVLEGGSLLFGGITIAGVLLAISALVWRKIQGSTVKKIVITCLVMAILITVFVATFYSSAKLWLSLAQ